MALEKYQIWYQNNKDKAMINQNNYRARHREKIREREKTYKNSFNGRLRALLGSSNKYAKQRKQEFSITYEDLIELWNLQEGLCSITKIPMQLESGTRQNKNYYRISIDRIDNSIGYTRENIHLVCFAVNQMKSDLTMKEFKFWIKTISSEAFCKEGPFNDYPERE